MGDIFAGVADLLVPVDRPIPPFHEWVRDRLGGFVWSKQREIGESVRRHRKTAVMSSHEVGKSYTAANLTAWWLDTHRPGEAFVVTTAPTFPQVRAVLWREIRKAHKAGNLPGRTNATEWLIGDELVAFGRKPADTDATAFQGIHARFVLVLIDEACGVDSQALWAAASSLCANEGSRMLAIGNPDNPASEFAKNCKPGSGWNVIQIGYADTPNFTGEYIPPGLSDLLISPIYVDEMRAEYGEDSPFYVSKCLGQFPIDSNDGVVPWSAVAACRKPDQPVDKTDTRIDLGVDVGAGGDETVVQERVGRKAGRRWRNNSKDSQEVGDFIVKCIKESGASRVKIDAIGVGWGVLGDLRRRKGKEHGAEIIDVIVSRSPADAQRFPLLRDEIWWTVGRELTLRREWDLSELDDTTTNQLIAPRYSIERGLIKVEPKKDTKKRLGRSPDYADALLLAFYEPATRGLRMRFRG